MESNLSPARCRHQRTDLHCRAFWVILNKIHTTLLNTPRATETTATGRVGTGSQWNYQSTNPNHRAAHALKALTKAQAAQMERRWSLLCLHASSTSSSYKTKRQIESDWKPLVSIFKKSTEDIESLKLQPRQLNVRHKQEMKCTRLTHSPQWSYRRWLRPRWQTGGRNWGSSTPQHESATDESKENRDNSQRNSTPSAPRTMVTRGWPEVRQELLFWPGQRQSGIKMSCMSNTQKHRTETPRQILGTFWVWQITALNTGRWHKDGHCDSILKVYVGQTWNTRWDQIRRRTPVLTGAQGFQPRMKLSYHRVPKTSSVI